MCAWWVKAHMWMETSVQEHGYGLAVCGESLSTASPGLPVFHGCLHSRKARPSSVADKWSEARDRQTFWTFIAEASDLHTQP